MNWRDLQRVQELEAEVARLTRERDEAKARITALEDALRGLVKAWRDTVNDECADQLLDVLNPKWWIDGDPREV